MTSRKAAFWKTDEAVTFVRHSSDVCQTSNRVYKHTDTFQSNVNITCYTLYTQV